MPPENTKIKQEDNNEALVKEGLSRWPDNLLERYIALPEKSYARRHADILLRGIGEFKARLFRILDGHEDYIRRKDSGT